MPLECQDIILDHFLPIKQWSESGPHIVVRVATFVGLGYIACVISYPVSCSNFILGEKYKDGTKES